ncbi:MAG: HD domain-containing protein [Thermoanaerobaculum sp.]|nr:HD domain-containing protein [Thermoanaerobaculum sp.]MDW7967857.1 HD domain-containing protein [Thermoanaerobaculum sp.]
MNPARWEELVRSLLTELAGGLTAMALYGGTHPRAASSVVALKQLLDELLAEEPQLDLVVLGEELFVQERPFTRSGRQAPAVLRRLARRGVEHVSFRAGVSEEELQVFLHDLVHQDAPAVRSQPHILVGKVELADESLAGADREQGRVGKGHLAAVRDRITLLAQVFVDFEASGSLAVSDLGRIADSLWELLEQDPQPMEHMAPWEGEERWPAVHAHNTACLAMGMAKLAGLSQGPVRELGVAALLHDLGKQQMPEEVRLRELSLSGPELELILDHPMEGAALLAKVPRLTPLAVIVAFEHHLHYNGTGYPRLSRPRRPHPAARLVSVADAFSVLVTARGARGLATRESSIAYLQERAGSIYDPAIVQALHELVLG